MASDKAAPTLANILYAIKGNIAHVIVNRPNVLNALNAPT
jgi:enoyl-CoA hydratase/carnithine racemase